MDMATATKNEWKLWSNRENVTLRAQTALGVYDAHPLSATGGAAKRRAPTWKEMTASAGGVTSKNLIWLLPNPNLPELVQPKAGDVIRDLSDIDHTILEVQLGKFGNTHRCVTIALAVVYELRQRGVLTRPTAAQDDAGRATNASYTTVGTVWCRLQPQDSAATEVHGRLTLPEQFAAYIDTPLSVRAKDVFTVTSYVSPGGAIASTQAYTVKGFRHPESLDALMQLDLELIS